MISLGMMSGWRRALELTRFLGSGRVDETKLSAECHRYLDRVTVLFNRHVLVWSGHTQWMLLKDIPDGAAFQVLLRFVMSVCGVSCESLIVFGSICGQMLLSSCNWMRMSTTMVYDLGISAQHR